MVMPIVWWWLGLSILPVVFGTMMFCDSTESPKDRRIGARVALLAWTWPLVTVGFIVWFFSKMLLAALSLERNDE